MSHSISLFGIVLHLLCDRGALCPACRLTSDFGEFEDFGYNVIDLSKEAKLYFKVMSVPSAMINKASKATVLLKRTNYYQCYF